MQLEHASLTDMYSATETAPTEEHVTAEIVMHGLSLFSLAQLRVERGKSLPTSGLRLQPGCEATLAHSA